MTQDYNLEIWHTHKCQICGKEIKIPVVEWVTDAIELVNQGKKVIEGKSCLNCNTPYSLQIGLHVWQKIEKIAYLGKLLLAPVKDPLLKEIVPPWNGASLPELEAIVDLLLRIDEQSGLESVKMLDSHTLYFKTKKPLTANAAYRLAVIGDDIVSPTEIYNDQTEFTIEWD